MKSLHKIEIARCLSFLDYFGIDWSKKTIMLSKGDSSIIMNPKTAWPDFAGCSVASVAKHVAKEMGKKIAWYQEHSKL